MVPAAAVLFTTGTVSATVMMACAKNCADSAFSDAANARLTRFVSTPFFKAITELLL